MSIKDLKVKSRSSRNPPQTVRAKIRPPAALAIDGTAPAPMPDFIEPCLATLVAQPPIGDEWVHEIKFDGYRIQAHLDGNDIKLLTRKGLDWTNRFGNVPALLRAIHPRYAVIDGELVVEDAEGHSSFTALADALKGDRAEKFVLQCFDLLYLDGVNLMGARLLDRKTLLQQLLHKAPKGGQVRYSEHLEGDGARMLAHACRLGLEGIISKRADKPYRPGRHDDWLKSKCIQTDEFVIVGYLDSNAAKNAIGALVVGFYDRNRLIYAGRVGTGFSQRAAAELYGILKPLRIAEAAVISPLTTLQKKSVVWVQPNLVAQIEYRALTGDNLLRHAAFKGLREDKPAREVRRPKMKGTKK